MLLNSMHIYGSLYVIYILFSLFISKIKYKNTIIVFWLLWSFLASFYAYLIVPEFTFDLFRYYGWIYESGIAYSSIWEAAEGDPLFVREVIYYLCSRMDSPHYFSAIPTFFQYFLPLLIIYLECIRANTSTKKILFLGWVFISVSDYFTITCVVRCPFSVAVFFFILYCEIRKIISSKFAFIVYLSIPFFHTIGFALLFFKLLFFCLKIKKTTFLFLIAAFGLVINTYFYEIVTLFNSDLLIALAWQSDSYFMNEETVSEMAGDGPKFIFYGAILFLFFITSVIVEKSDSLKKYFDEKLYAFLSFLQICAIFALLAGGINQDVSNRFTYPLILGQILFFVPLINNTCVNKRLLPVLLLYSIFGLIYQTRYYPFVHFYL